MGTAGAGVGVGSAAGRARPGGIGSPAHDARIRYPEPGKAALTCRVEGQTDLNWPADGAARQAHTDHVAVPESLG